MAPRSHAGKLAYAVFICACYLTIQCTVAQLDSFNRAASGKSGKFGRLFSGRKSSPKTPGKDSPAKSDPPTPSTQPSLSLDDMLIYQPVSRFNGHSGITINWG